MFGSISWETYLSNVYPLADDFGPMLGLGIQGNQDSRDDPIGDSIELFDSSDDRSCVSISGFVPAGPDGSQALVRNDTFKEFLSYRTIVTIALLKVSETFDLRNPCE